MGGRYWITGVQLGMLLSKIGQKEKKEIMDEIVDNQYLGTEEELKKMKEKGEGKNE